MLKSNNRDSNYAYILIRGDIITTARNNPTPLASKRCAQLTKCITKNDGTTIDGAEGLDLVMPMYVLLEHNSNYSNTTGSSWFYSTDKATNFNADIVEGNKFKSFNYKAKFLISTVADGTNGIIRDTTITYWDILLRTITSFIKGNYFYDQPINSDIKRYEEIRKLATSQDEYYTAWFLFSYE